MTLTARFEKFTKLLSYVLIPHEGNNHHPWAIRHQGLAIFVLGIFVSQIITNVAVGKEALTLGFATNIEKEQLISLTNVQRTSQGVGTLVENPALSQAALLKAQDMFAKNYWAHVGPDGTTPWHFFNIVGYKYQYAGENLAKGFDTSSGVVNGWMNSVSHRDNLLNGNYREIGMAVLNGQLGGESTTLVVQLFGSTSQPSVAAQKPVETQALVQTTPKPTVAPRPVVTGLATATASFVNPIGPTGVVPRSPLVRALEAYQPKGALNLNQQILAMSLVILATIFLVDTLILTRKRLLHQHSPSLLHALVIITLIGFVLVSGRGVIL